MPKRSCMLAHKGLAADSALPSGHSAAEHRMGTCLLEEDIACHCWKQQREGDAVPC